MLYRTCLRPYKQKTKKQFFKSRHRNKSFCNNTETPINNFEKVGKNFYISNIKKNIKITVNSNTYRVITADKIIK
ncbi:DUF3781 domain-containing protein [Haoranjiania flava]|uniref:DUF3781 domain-containing protein n=1 Tax=Haoranjiania flava TaxID=1856322 RepID=UPI003636C0F7